MLPIAELKNCSNYSTSKIKCEICGVDPLRLITSLRINFLRYRFTTCEITISLEHLFSKSIRLRVLVLTYYSYYSYGYHRTFKSMKLYMWKRTYCRQEIQWHSYGRGQRGFTPKIFAAPRLAPLFTYI